MARQQRLARQHGSPNLSIRLCLERGEAGQPRNKVMSASRDPKASDADRLHEADPAGFAERGAVIAFTTPQLFGARLSRARPGAEAELTLLNLAGQAGRVTLTGAALRANPDITAHDRWLWKKIEALPEISPESLREALISTAAEGWRGRAAMAWAEEIGRAHV